MVLVISPLSPHSALESKSDLCQPPIRWGRLWVWCSLLCKRGVDVSTLRRWPSTPAAPTSTARCCSSTLTTPLPTSWRWRSWNSETVSDSESFLTVWVTSIGKTVPKWDHQQSMPLKTSPRLFELTLHHYTYLDIDASFKALYELTTERIDSRVQNSFSDQSKHKKVATI